MDKPRSPMNIDIAFIPTWLSVNVKSFCRDKLFALDSLGKFVGKDKVFGIQDQNMPSRHAKIVTFFSLMTQLE